MFYIFQFEGSMVLKKGILSVILGFLTVLPGLFISCGAADGLIGLNADFLPENRNLEIPVITQTDTVITVNTSTAFSVSVTWDNTVYHWAVLQGGGSIEEEGETVTYTASGTAEDVIISCYATRTGFTDSGLAQAELTVTALEVLPTPGISGLSALFPSGSAVFTASGSGAGVTYSWSVTGGGAIGATGTSVTYTAPAGETTAVISCAASQEGYADSSPSTYTVYVKNNHYALLTSTTTTAGTDFNPASATAVSWTGINIDSDYFDHNGINPERLTVKQDGDYFLALTIPFQSALLRSAVRSEVYVNGTVVPGTVAESSYIRNSSAHSESSDHLAVLLDGLSANDYIEVKVLQGGILGTVTVSSIATLYVEYVEPEKVIFSGTATETTGPTPANLNESTAYPLKWTHSVNESGYTHSNSANPEDIILDSAGYYLVFVNLPLSNADYNIRFNVKAVIELDGATVPGGEAKQGYIRAYSGHQESSVHWSGLVYAASAGSTLRVKTQREASSGTVTTGTGRSASLYIEKVEPAAFVFSGSGTALSGGSDWNPLPAQDILWTTTGIIDSDTYTHSTGANSQNVVITQAGDYLLVYNDALGFTGAPDSFIRMNPTIQVHLDGTTVTGAETKTHYVRNYSTEGNYESSGSLVFYLRSVTSGQVVTVTAGQEGETGTMDDSHAALLTLIRKN